MHFSWNPQTIIWFKAASTYTSFHCKLAKKLRPAVTGSRTMWDIGCGLGLLSQQLYEDVGEIVCLDTNEAALHSLQEDVSAKGIPNIKPRLGDCYETEPQGDVILLSYFGSRSIEQFLPCCSLLVSIVDLDENSSMGGRLLSGVNRKRQTSGTVEEALRSKGRRYSLEKVTLEFGQPFRSLEDGMEFLQQYYRCGKEESELFLHERAIPADGQELYQYYLPYLGRSS
jgi:hypothetical protein